MKKIILGIGLTTIIALTGCSKNMANRDVYEESGHTVNVNNKRHELYNEGGSMGIRNVSKNYGFVRHQKSPVMNDYNTNTRKIALDREQVAHIISSYAANIPNINDVATLVTDQEVLIAYRTDAKDRTLAADQVKRTAMSVVPRYYHVFVTDNANLMQDVENLANLDSNSRNARNLVNGLVKQMKKSPQGYTMGNGEDANGMTPEDHTMNRNNNR